MICSVSQGKYFPRRAPEGYIVSLLTMLEVMRALNITGYTILIPYRKSIEKKGLDHRAGHFRPLRIIG